MRQRRFGQKVQNWHRPLAPGQLGARYRRLRELPEGSRGLDLPEWEVRRTYYCCPECEAIERGDGWDVGTSARFQELLRVLAARAALSGLARGLAAVRLGREATGAADAPAQGALEERLAAHERWLRAGLDRPEALADTLLLAVPGAGDRPAIECEARRSEAPWLLRNLVLFVPFWRRSPADWVAPQGGSAPGAPGRSLVEFVFGDYPVPASLLREWYDRSESLRCLRWLQWTVLFAQGGSLQRFARLLGGALPRRFQHHLAGAPADIDAAVAVERAEVLCLGGSDVELRLLRASGAFEVEAPELLPEDARRLPRDPEHAAFRAATVGWLARHRDELAVLENESCLLILRWAMHEFTEVQRDGRRFDWRGRGVEPSFERAYRCTFELRYRRRAREPHEWSARGYDAEFAVYGEPWQFVELTSSRALEDESAAMHHCVASYDELCADGRAAIVSARRAGKRVLTIEVVPAQRRAVQICGVHNRRPTADELRVVARWLEVLRARGAGPL